MCYLNVELHTGPRQKSPAIDSGQAEISTERRNGRRKEIKNERGARAIAIRHLLSTQPTQD